MMGYSVDLRERVVGYVRSGGGLTEAARLFKVSRTTLYRKRCLMALLPHLFGM